MNETARLIAGSLCIAQKITPPGPFGKSGGEQVLRIVHLAPVCSQLKEPPNLPIDMNAMRMGLRLDPRPLGLPVCLRGRVLTALRFVKHPGAGEEPPNELHAPLTFGVTARPFVVSVRVHAVGDALVSLALIP